MGAMAFQITSLTIVSSTVYSGADQRRHKKNLLVTGLCVFPAQIASNAENVSIWWRHHERCCQSIRTMTSWLANGFRVTGFDEYPQRAIPTITSVSATHSPALQWRHNERHSVSNHQPRDCLFNCLFRRRSKKTSKLRVTGLCEGNSPWTGEFPAQRTSKAENVSIWWRHHERKGG